MNTSIHPAVDLREQHGPFDIIGDVHGCFGELVTLLTRLGWQFESEDDLAINAEHPAGRIALFLGDLVDRGPATPAVLRLVMNMVASGSALAISGNHEAKLCRALDGRGTSRSHGLQESLDQLAAETPQFRAAARHFMGSLPTHLVLADGRLVAAHAGLREDLHGIVDGKSRAFALYGDTTGEKDDAGFPIRKDWAQKYSGAATVVYGHTPVREARWVNNTICLDTAVVFGGALTAMRYPERELVSVPATKQWTPHPARYR